MSIKDEAAFAAGVCIGIDEGYVQTGLTKREYFAALAMQALVGQSKYTSHMAAQYAVEAADMLIQELCDE